MNDRDWLNLLALSLGGLLAYAGLRMTQLRRWWSGQNNNEAPWYRQLFCWMIVIAFILDFGLLEAAIEALQRRAPLVQALDVPSVLARFLAVVAPVYCAS